MPSFENLVRVLTANPAASDVELAFRLGCKRALVANARASLGMPPRPLPPLDEPVSPEVRLMIGAVLQNGGHRRWVGRRTRDGVPLLDAHTTVNRVAFRLAHGRAPEGTVRVGCVIKHCVEGLHLTDRIIREATRAGVAA
ncbi:hypothetical protein PV387_23130 [Streptomyces sp. ME02-6987-2C]|uniref:hypothetical protein n=1 Tax=unclassified Streptomyces TaxID=2593676 RepID=UPI0029B62C06|nr:MULTISPECIES: hypothetical protein [unclassified Streptomyces]MDX3345984.1 hypothetical protein [Streptomyces sp. ME02-6979A]MDX3368896.1 hypothetical protein [Streptomyces sp. ME02-6987-2C]MDX3407793.1 hypothetical protein [Streptomyces sp. ME02-6977A]MDX3421750.1 hypothetical protein [Streptomyces sp. ME02-6985-2c]